MAETVATQIGQSRTGVKTTLISRIDREIVSDRVLSTAVVPYIRSRNILVQVKGLKPNTRFYPYFDDVTVSNFCTPASKLTYLPVSGQFDAVAVIQVERLVQIKDVTTQIQKINGVNYQQKNIIQLQESMKLLWKKNFHLTVSNYFFLKFLLS